MNCFIFIDLYFYFISHKYFFLAEVNILQVNNSKLRRSIYIEISAAYVETISTVVRGGRSTDLVC